MGIRVHKVLCYALGDVKSKDSRIVDSRFQDWVREDDYYDKTEKSLVPFLEWTKTNKDECNQLLRKFNRRTLDDWFFVHFCESDLEKITDEKERQQFLNKRFHSHFIYDGEFGLPRVFGIVPIDFPHWYQYDNIIDYYVEDSGKNHIKWLDKRCGIWPFTGVVLKPGKEPVGKLGEHPNAGEFNIAVGRWEMKREPTLSPEEVKLALKNYRFNIPSSILLWTYYLNLFKDWESTVSELRPALYTYWS